MEATFITAGIACIIAAIVGGGLKAFGIEIRALDSLRRQAALGAFGVVLVAAGLISNRAPQSQSPAAASPEPAASTQPAATTQPSASTSDCNRAWFGKPSPARVVVMESGTADADILAPDQSKDDPVVVIITEDARPVGAVAFKFYVSNDLFKITQVVNANCEPIETFRNESRGGDRRVLQNFDTVELTFGALKYTLRLGYSAGTIDGTLNRV